MNTYCVYDIETVPLSEERLVLVEPVHEAPSNYKAEEAIAKAKAEKAVAWREKAALSPITGRVAMFGTRDNDGATYIAHLKFKDASDEQLDEQEADLLGEFWEFAEMLCASGTSIVSFNGHAFDLPFMIKRSWGLGVKIPRDIQVFGQWGPQAPWLDLAKAWQCGDRTAERISLNALGQYFGVGQKDGDCTLLRHQLEHEPEKAIAYLRQDLILTEQVGIKMGILVPAKPFKLAPV